MALLKAATSTVAIDSCTASASAASVFRRISPGESSSPIEGGTCWRRSDVVCDGQLEIVETAIPEALAGTHHGRCRRSGERGRVGDAEVDQPLRVVERESREARVRGGQRGDPHPDTSERARLQQTIALRVDLRGCPGWSHAAKVENSKINVNHGTSFPRRRTETHAPYRARASTAERRRQPVRLAVRATIVEALTARFGAVLRG